MSCKHNWIIYETRNGMYFNKENSMWLTNDNFEFYMWSPYEDDFKNNEMQMPGTGGVHVTITTKLICSECNTVKILPLPHEIKDLQVELKLKGKKF